MQCWGRTIVWPPQEEYLDSDIESLLRGYPDPRVQTTAVPPHPSNSPLQLQGRDGRLYSRIRSTTEHPSSESVADQEKESGQQFNPVAQSEEDLEYWHNIDGFPQVPVQLIEESKDPIPDKDTRLQMLLSVSPEEPSSQSPKNQDRKALILDLDEEQTLPVGEGDESNPSQSSLADHGRAAAHVDPNHQSNPQSKIRPNNRGPSNHPVPPNRRVSSNQQRIPSDQERDPSDQLQVPTSHQRVPNNPQPVPSQSRYNSRPWYSPTRVNCRHVEKVVKVQQCEPYTVETCWEEAKQECSPQPVTNCTGIIDTRLEQVCFNVEDELCTLVETVVSEKSEDSYQTQHCFFGQEAEVCGTSYEVQKLEMDDYGCTSVNVLNCHQVSQYLHDVNCIESVEFECKEDGYQPNTVLPRIVCTPNPTQNCYKIPRKVFSEVCEVTPSRHCESFINLRAMPVEMQKCKPYIKKSCDFKIETSPHGKPTTSP